MLSVNLNLKDRSYDIVIGNKNLKDLGQSLVNLNIGKDAVIITNPIIKKHHGRAISSGLKKYGFSVKFFEVPSGEESKSAQVAFDLIEEIAQYSVKKGVFVIAFGGGVVGDLAGFIAATYRRGIPYIQVPTTLLAQVDSAIGGKVAVDLPMGKNLVGAFYQPKVVWSDVAVLSTLDERQIINGLAEVIKYGIICDRALFKIIERDYKKLLSLDPVTLKEVILCCSRIKAKVVSSDEKETTGVRAILNFGHTVGHAIESANQYKDYHHGEAVALGMRVAVSISRRLKLIPEDQASLINEVITNIGLPVNIKAVSMDDILKHMEHDKKFKAGKNRFVLVRGIGSVKVVEGINRDIIKSSIKEHYSST